MIGTISPLVEGLMRSNRQTATPPWVVLWLIHVAASFVGGALTGAAVGWAAAVACAPVARLLISLPGDPNSTRVGYFLVAAVSLFAALHDLGFIRLRLPYLHRQVPRRWVYDLPPAVMAAGFGLQLGSVFFTHTPFASVYVVALYGGLVGHPHLSALLLGLCGAARGAPLLVLALMTASGDDVIRMGRFVLSTRAPAGASAGILSLLLAATTAYVALQ